MVRARRIPELDGGQREAEPVDGLSRKMGRDVLYVAAWGATFVILTLQAVIIAWMLM